MPNSIPTLRKLANIIIEAVDTIEHAYARSGVDLPALEVPFNAADPVEALRQDPVVSGATMELMAATSQIAATVCNPATAISNASQSFHISSCLRVAPELNVVELLREAGPEANLGLLEFNGTTARIIRLLATHSIFREVSPNVFASNRISSTLDKVKSPSDLFANREDRFAGTSGVTALIEFLQGLINFLSDFFRSSSYLTDTILTPKEGIVPYNRAFDSTEPMYHWIQRPENVYKLRRFGLGMQGTAASEPSDTIFQGFDWSVLEEGAVLVDIGGGIGHLSLTIVKRYPKLRVVIQDLPHTVDEAKDHWTENYVEHVEGRMVEFQGHDFFTPQPVKKADIFLLRYIFHNWPDAKAVPILQHLRDAALPTTQLVIVEKILPVASADQGCEVNDIPGAERPVAKAPLLSNWGIATAELYFYDIGIHTMLGGEERTLDGYIDVLRKSGWKLAQVYHCGRSQLSHLVAKPM
ncbi:O-methyltransferase [Mycena leptocephala]|nr:O-methyltransferase [Mycena leptocephala]